MNIRTIEDIRYELQQVYHNVYDFITSDDEIILYRLINKEEYSYICNNNEMDELELQDAIVNTCVLYPENLNTDDMSAGDVTNLASEILNTSYVLPKDRIELLEYLYSEMTELDNMMIGIILEAFQSYKLEDLEKMDYPTLYKLYTRAEWNLVYLRGINIPAVLDPIESIKINIGESEEVKNNEPVLENSNIPKPEPQGKYMGKKMDDVMSEISKPINNSQSKRKPMTKEEQEALERFKKQFPEMNMEFDAMYTGAESQSADTTPVALRVPGKH